MNNRFEYDEAYYNRRELSRTFRAEINAVIKELNPSETDTILDLGCGGGVLVSHLARYGCHRVIGLDWLETSVSLTARAKKSNVEIICGDALNLPFGANEVDKIASQHLIEHFEDTVGVLQEWGRVLRPDGKMVLITPNRLFPHQQWFDDPTHCHIFTLEQLAEFVEKAGFQINTARIVNPYVFHWRLNGFAATYLQSWHKVPWIGKRGMGILIAATKSRTDSL